MTEFQSVAQVGDIPVGEGRAFPINGRMVAVFYVQGEYCAINDTCPHMGASLSTGWLETEVVTCPWHAWRFCIKDGTWVDNPDAKVQVDSFPVRVINGEIQVQVPHSPFTG